MKEKIRKIVGVILVVSLCGGTLGVVSHLVERKASDVKYMPFFEQDEDYQVLFIGNSHTALGIFLMELWKEYGIVSYNFGGHGNTIPTTYWVLMNALDYTVPDVVVLDCSKISTPKMTSTSIEQVHLSLDAFPLSSTKIDTIKDQVPEDKQLDFLWKFSTYHNRWNDLTQEDWKFEYTKEKGAESKVVVAKPQETEKISEKKMFEGNNYGVQYLEKIIMECQSRNIQLLLTYLPFPADEKKQMESHRVAAIAEEYGVDYINFLDMNIVDYDTDCSDGYSHLNPSGAKKVTSYLGKYLTENYGIKDQRNNSAYKQWNNDYDEYALYKTELLKSQSSLDTYLMLLADKDWNIVITMNNSAIWDVPLYKKLLNNIGFDSEDVGTEEALDGDIHVLVTDKKKETVIDNVVINYEVEKGELLPENIEIIRPWG